MEQRLQEAAIQGNTSSLNQILGEDPLILQRVMVGCFVHTPLHVAASKGHLEFVRALLDNNKELARVLDPRRWSALHLAAANGHDEVVEVLVEANANMCLTLDGDGRNPLHLAAMEGHDSVLEVFFERNPDWIHEFLKAIDGGGNTIIHLAIKDKKFETVKLLLDKIKKQVKVKNIRKTDNPLNVVNKCECTALDILEELKYSKIQDVKKVKKKFQEAGALKAAALKADQVLSKRQDVLMVVASLMATMAFQAGVAPPGGVWQDDSPSNSTDNHYAGQAVIAYSDQSLYDLFSYANTIGFVASLSTILFLVTGLPVKKKLFTRIMVMTMCLTITSMALTYAYSITMTNRGTDYGNLTNLVSLGVIVWCGVICVLVLIHTMPFLNRWLKVIWDIIWPWMKAFMKFSWGIIWPQTKKFIKFSWDIIRPQMEKFMKFISPSGSQPLPTSSNGE